MINASGNFNCPVEATLSLIGGKYKAILLYHLVRGTLRFGELQRMTPSATPKMLTQQLRELESDGLISRTVYPVVPPRTEYALTDFGRSLMPVLDAMCVWGKGYMNAKSASCVFEREQGGEQCRNLL